MSTRYLHRMRVSLAADVTVLVRGCAVASPVADGVGVGALARRELEVARRIVDRQTNRQIADELFLSPRTVETHARNIFAKLGADSRAEGARIVERAERRAAYTQPAAEQRDPS